MYEIRMNHREVKNAREIVNGCTLEQDNQFPELMESFENKEDAINALKKYNGTVQKMSKYFLVTEYYVEENEYDEDGEWISGGDIWAFAGLPEVE